MQNLRAKEPEGTMTPDNVQVRLALSHRLHDCPEKLRKLVVSLVPQVPLRHQRKLKDILEAEDIVDASIEFINTVSRMMGDNEPFIRNDRR
jgi:hypothetical protein